MKLLRDNKKMKNLILLLALAVVGNLNAQNSIKVNLTPEGLLFPSGKKYTVIEYENYSAQDLYKSFLAAVNSIYFSGKDVVSKVEGKSISISAYQSDAIVAKRLRNPKYSYDIAYSITFLFKDGKVRLNTPDIQKINAGKNKLIITGEKSFWKSVQPIYDRKGKLRFTYVKESVEKFFNTILNSILEEKKSQDEW